MAVLAVLCTFDTVKVPFINAYYVYDEVLPPSIPAS